MYFAIVGTMVMEAIVKAQAGRITQNRRTMKVSELTGAQLDYWVGQIEGRIVRVDAIVDGYRCYERVDSALMGIGHRIQYSPSTDWSQGGPIIDRERIDIAWQALSWFAEHPIDDRGAFGPTPLIAAMRAYVASKYGVEVPDNPA